jgi:hypothetical protein
VGFVVDKVALGQVFFENVGFPYHFLFLQILYTHPPPGAGAIGQIVADVASALSLTPPHRNKKQMNCIGSYGLLAGNLNKT